MGSSGSKVRTRRAYVERAVLSGINKTCSAGKPERNPPSQVANAQTRSATSANLIINRATLFYRCGRRSGGICSGASAGSFGLRSTAGSYLELRSSSTRQLSERPLKLTPTWMVTRRIASPRRASPEIFSRTRVIHGVFIWKRVFIFHALKGSC